MKYLKFNAVVIKAILTVFVSLNSYPAFSANSCKEILKSDAAPKSITHYLNQVDVKGSKDKEPKFLDPKEERFLAESWVGIRTALRSVKAVLQSGSAMLDFQLLSADAGAVKGAQPGKFTSFRLNHEWRGKDMSTNVGLPIDAMVLRGLENKPGEMLVPEKAKAVFMFMHGGGTKTTGHHVAAAFANYLVGFGVVVLSIDAPYHAYGPRLHELTPMEYYEYLRDFRHRYVPKDVPVFIGGHSMGGLHADNLMRMSDRKELGMHEAFKGLINLSGPMDSAPGESLEEKARVEDEINSNEDLMSLVPEAERDLTVSLLLDGKSSALSGVSAETFMGEVNWEKPEHNGAEYIPTLALMGERDALYVGREQIFQDYIADLENTETHIMGLSFGFADEKEPSVWVSHMIFDHYRAGTKTQETFLLVKDFIESQLGEELAHEGQLLTAIEGPTTFLVAEVIQAYLNNLAFRKFSSQYKLLDRRAKPKVAEIDQLARKIQSDLKPIWAEIKKLQKTDPDAAAAKQAEIAEAEKTLNDTRALQQSLYIPENSEDTEFATDNINKRKELSNMAQQNNQRRRALMKELSQLRDQRNSLQTKSEELIEKALEREVHEHRDLALTQAAIEKALTEMLDLQVEMNERNSKMVQDNIKKGVYEIDPPADLIAVYKALDKAYAKYNEEVAKGRAIVERLMSEDEFGVEFVRVYVGLHGLGSEVGLVEKIRAITEEIEALELETSRLNDEVSTLLISYVDRVTPDLYTVVETTMYDELNKPLSEMFENTTAIQKLWKIWHEIWKERPPEQSTSLY